MQEGDENGNQEDREEMEGESDSERGDSNAEKTERQTATAGTTQASSRPSQWKGVTTSTFYFKQTRPTAGD